MQSNIVSHSLLGRRFLASHFYDEVTALRLSAMLRLYDEFQLDNNVFRAGIGTPELIKSKRTGIRFPEEKDSLPGLRIWHIPQVPMKAFRYEVKNLVEAKCFLNALAHYDIWLFENDLKPDYCNAAGLEVENEEWTEEDGEDMKFIDWSTDSGTEIDALSLEDLQAYSYNKTFWEF